MNMKRRESILATATAVVFGIWLFGGSLLELTLGPVEARTQELAALNVRLAELKKLNEWKNQSLARPDGDDVGRATEQYRQWVWDLAETVGEFEGVNVGPYKRVSGAARRGLVPVQVKLTAQATLGNIKKFLYHFYQADLLHRIVSIQLETDTHDGDPTLEVAMVAEGLSLPYAAAGVSNRDTLFPRTLLVDDVGADELELTVEDQKGFPTKAFRVRAGAEFFDVTKTEKRKWTVERGESADDHDADTTVELATIHADREKLQLEDYKFVNPFARYIPQLVFVGSKRYTLGDTVKLTARLTGIEPDAKPSYFLVSPPKELSIEKATGKLEWKSNDDQESGQVTIRVEAKLGTRTLSGETSIQFNEVVVKKTPVRNDEPVLVKLDDISGIAGRAVEFTASATDREDGKLSFRLAEGAPEGATIGAETGKFRWVPESPGKFEVNVTVSDDGSPAKKSTATVTISITLNPAEFTVLVASITRNGKKEVWLRDQLNNKLFVLQSGSRFKADDVDAEVVSIGSQEVVFRVGKNDHRVKLGESLQKLRETDAEKPTEKASEKSGKPTEKATEKASEKSGKPTEKPTEKASEKSGKPTEKATEKAPEKSGKPAEKATDKAEKKPADDQ